MHIFALFFAEVARKFRDLAESVQDRLRGVGGGGGGGGGGFGSSMGGMGGMASSVNPSGLRDLLNRNAPIVAGVVGAIVLVFVGWTVYSSFLSNSGTGSSETITLSFYTVDDGKTYFSELAVNVPPFPHKGKQAFRAHVFTCDGGKSQFVGLVERLSKAARESLSNLSDNTPDYERMRAGILASGIEVKKPGAPETAWTMISSTANFAKVADVKCPDGTTAKLERVDP